MGATPEGTKRFAEEADLAEVGYGSLGSTGLTVSRLGFGTYRVDDRNPAHREALLAAVLAGVNLIDTATNYGGGGAEKLVGAVVRELVEAGKIRRDEVVIVSKAGFAQGEDAARIRSSFPGLTELAQGTLHGMTPAFLDDQLSGSLARLGLDRVDAYLLHNPETYLSHAARSDPQGDRGARLAGLEERLREAFAFLESACDEGRISFYGVSSNGLSAAPGDVEQIEPARLVELAREVRPEPRLAILELPLNLLEPGAALHERQGGGTTLSIAAQAGLAVLANRPLNAFREERLLRLADPGPPPEAPPLADAADEVEAIEAIFAQDFAPRIKVEGPGPAPDTIFQWGRELARAPSRVAGLDHWRAIQQQVIAPQVNAVLPGLARAFGGDAAFEAWARRYAAALPRLLEAVTAEIVRDAGRQAAALSARLDGLLPSSWSRASLSRRALGTVMWTPGVSSVLAGMRRRELVEDALGAVGLPPPDPEAPGRAYRGLA